MKDKFDTFKHDEGKSAFLRKNGLGCHHFGETSFPEKLHAGKMNDYTFKTRGIFYHYFNGKSTQQNKAF